MKVSGKPSLQPLVHSTAVKGLHPSKCSAVHCSVCLGPPSATISPVTLLIGVNWPSWKAAALESSWEQGYSNLLNSDRTSAQTWAQVSRGVEMWVVCHLSQNLKAKRQPPQQNPVHVQVTVLKQRLAGCISFASTHSKACLTYKLEKWSG